MPSFMEWKCLSERQGGKSPSQCSQSLASAISSDISSNTSCIFPDMFHIVLVSCIDIPGLNRQCFFFPDLLLLQTVFNRVLLGVDDWKTRTTPRNKRQFFIVKCTQSEIYQPCMICETTKDKNATAGWPTLFRQPLRNQATIQAKLYYG